MKHGQGSCAKAEAYLLGEKDAKSELRSGVRVIKGDMHITTQLADSLEFKNKYTSLVIAWHPSDKPTDGEVEEVLGEFEALAFSGLGSNQYNMTAVLHTEKDGSRHVHIVIARVELQTGNSMNVAPPNYRGFDYLSDYLNESKGWRSPDVRSPNYSGRGAGPSVWGLRKELKNVIDASLADAIEMGLIDNQDDVIAHINSLTGVECINSSKYFITIKTNDMKRGMRLKDAQYRRGYDFQNDRDSKGTEVSEECRLPISNRERISELKERVAESANRRVQYNQSRYTDISEINVGAFSIDEREFVKVNRRAKEKHPQSFKNQQKQDSVKLVEGGPHPDSLRGGFNSDFGVDEYEGDLSSDAEEYGNLNPRGWEPVAEFRSRSNSERRQKIRPSLLTDQVEECKGGNEKQASILERASQPIKSCLKRASRATQQAVASFRRAGNKLEQASSNLNSGSQGLRDRADRMRKFNQSLEGVIQETKRVDSILEELVQHEISFKQSSGVEQESMSFDFP